MVLEMTGAKREAMSFVGDRIYTDVKTGVVNGAHGILVLTGETKLEDVPKADVVPDAIFHRAERDGRNTQDYERRGSIE